MTQRIVTIDAVRGVAVLGILLMNIVSMGLPAYAYLNPAHAGGDAGANLWAWALTHVFVDGKMRALFTLLFGASLLLIADAADAAGAHAAQRHYRRLLWLFVIGMIHAWGFWYGDILVSYAVAGAVVFWARGWPAHRLFAAGGIVLAGLALYNLSGWWWFDGLRADIAAGRPVAPDMRAALDGLFASETPAAREIALYQGGIADAFAARAPETLYAQTRLLFTFGLPEGVGLMLIGMGLFRTGFFSGEWPAASCRRMLWLIPAAALATLPVTLRLARSRWDGVDQLLSFTVNVALAPAMALGYAAAVILLVRSGALAAVTARLAAAGRMALTNYLGATLLATSVFYGYGLGLFGRLERAELYWVVLAIWSAQLWFSPWWLARFRYGPAEWAWRSLARWKRQPLRAA